MANPPGFVGTNGSPNGFNAQSGRFFSVYFGTVRIGGLQNVRYTESFGTHWVGEIGSDHKEPEFGLRQVSGSADKLTLNHNKLRDLLMGGNQDTGQLDIDLRNYMFTLKLTYHEKYILPDGASDSGVGITSSAQAGPVQETIYNVMFTDLSISLNDPTSLAREDITFIGYAVGGQSAAGDFVSQPTS